jgi:hypothetical protein
MDRCDERVGEVRDWKLVLQGEFMRRNRSLSKSSLPWLMVAAVVVAFGMAGTLFGWPHNAQAAGGFAEFVGAVLSPVSLVLVVLSLNAQESTERSALQNHFTGLQVQALIALIEDDRAKISSMVSSGDHVKKREIFKAINQRYKRRLGRLNTLAKAELKMPDEAESGSPSGFDD